MGALQPSAAVGYSRSGAAVNMRSAATAGTSTAGSPASSAAPLKRWWETAARTSIDQGARRALLGGASKGTGA